MPPSTPAFASAELAPAAQPAASPTARTLTSRAALELPGGRIGLTLCVATAALALFAPLISGADPFALAAAPLSPPSLGHPLGTDALGRDLLSGVLYGARTSLGVAAGVTVLAGACGACVGLLAGYRGGLLDDALMRATELFQVLPRFFLVVIVLALFGPGVDRVILGLGLTSWPVLARVVRGEVLAMRELDFVVAARAAGARERRVLWRHLLPNLLPSALVVLGLLFGQALLVEATLGFLGLGDPNAMSWGLLAGQARGFLRVAWWLSLFPGLAIAAAVLGVNLLADAASASVGGR